MQIQVPCLDASIQEMERWGVNHDNTPSVVIFPLMRMEDAEAEGCCEEISRIRFLIHVSSWGNSIGSICLCVCQSVWAGWWKWLPLHEHEYSLVECKTRVFVLLGSKTIFCGWGHRKIWFWNPKVLKPWFCILLSFVSPLVLKAHNFYLRVEIKSFPTLIDQWKCSFCEIQRPMLDYSAMSHPQIQ